MSEEVQEWWGERQSPSGVSHRSQDSGFSDSEAGGTNGGHWGLRPPKDQSERNWLDTGELTARLVTSTEDLSSLPPPAHSSTPKAQRVHLPRKSECPVSLWLREVRSNCDPECMTTLQSKSITSELGQRVALTTAMTKNDVWALYQRAKDISSQFENLYRSISCGDMSQVEQELEALMVQITDLTKECTTGEKELEKVKKGLEAAKTSMIRKTIDKQHHLRSLLKALATALTQRIDQLLLNQIRILVNIMEEENCPASLLCVLSGIAGLGLKVPHLADLLARCSGITALLSLCISSRSAPVRTASLRTLATVCSTPTSIMQFERGGGVEIICDILSDKTKGETERSEAASVLTQVTAPWLENGHTVHNLEKYLFPLISALTNLITKTNCQETVLLAAAALANISWAEPRSVWPLVECSSAIVLLDAVQACACVFLKEQVATLLANMSAVAEVRLHLAKYQTVPALLCFLQVSHSMLQSPPQLAAAYRVQHKSAIALSRLCSEPEVAYQVVQLQGVSNLARLCREEKERNNSDGVLVACLAALRKIAANCGRKVIDDLQVNELVDPKLLESFLLYSSRQEPVS